MSGKSSKPAVSKKNINPLGGRPITENCQVYSCRMCRKLLFTSNDLLPHDNTRDARGHKKFKFQGFHSDEQKSVCTSLFLDPDIATWVAKESREVQEQRLSEMEKQRQAIEDEEIFGAEGRPETPPLTAPLVYDDDGEAADDDRFGDDFDEDEGAEARRKLVIPATATTTSATSATAPAAASAPSTKKTADSDDDDDSDEEIISSDDEKDKKNKKKPAPAPKKAAVASAATTVKPSPKVAANAHDDDSDEEIISSDDEKDKKKNNNDEDDDEDFFDDDDDFQSNFGGGGHNAARRKEFRVTKAALDIVDPDTIYCPHCSCKIGTQNWIGSQCSCAAWVTPAFKVHAKSVDAIPGQLYLRLYQE